MASEKIWVDKDGSGGWKRPGGKGERLIILHAGSTQLSVGIQIKDTQ